MFYIHLITNLTNIQNFSYISKHKEPKCSICMTNGRIFRMKQSDLSVSRKKLPVSVLCKLRAPQREHATYIIR